MEDLAWMHNAFSTERLGAYFTHADTDDLIEALRLYRWNLALSQSFYPLLQNIEIALRNNLNHALTLQYKLDIDAHGALYLKINPDDSQLHRSWLELPGLLEYRERIKVQQSADYIFKKQHPVTAGKVVANLNFGFWTKLFDSKYEKKIWHKVVKEVFPFAPATMRTRKKMAIRFNRFMNLRNRVFHHEPIFNKPNLKQIHDELLETLEWMQPKLANLTKDIDNFQVVYSQKEGTS